MRTTAMTSDGRAPVYVIGDVHGMISQLQLMIAAAEEDARRIGGSPRFLFVGDLVDKGMNSCQVLQAVSELIEFYPGSQLILGNHDARFLDFARGQLNTEFTRHWLTKMSGSKTLRSYANGAPSKISELGDFIKQTYPSHLALLENAADMVLLDQYCVVHAGVRPNVPLAEQDVYDLRWIRGPFLGTNSLFERTVIHGHTPTDTTLPSVFHNRIALDTNAGRFRNLAAVVIAGELEPRFITASVYDDNSWQVSHRPRYFLVEDYWLPCWKQHSPPEIVEMVFEGEQLTIGEPIELGAPSISRASTLAAKMA
jgi:serine/threonine protein phosphatase 1